MCPVDEIAASRTWEDWKILGSGEVGREEWGGVQRRRGEMGGDEECRVQWSRNLRQQQDETGPSRENKVGGSLVPLHIG